jgi:hypothetical protein
VTRISWRQTLGYAAVVGLGGGLLSACVSTPSHPPPAPPLQALREAPQWQPPPWHIIPRPARKPTPPTQPNGQAAAKPVAPKPVAAQPLVRKPFATPPPSGELIGLDQPKVARLFGHATEKIAQPPATVWRYKTAGCELDLFFYLDLRSGQMRTLHYAFKGDVGNPEKRQDCLRAIVADRAG